MRLSFVGPGRAGLSLGYALWQTGQVQTLTYYGRRPEPPSHPLFIQGLADYLYGIDRPPHGTTAVVLSVPDEELVDTAEVLARCGEAPPDCSAFHLSGTLSSDPLAALHMRGYSVGSMHPLVTFGNPVSGAERLQGAYVLVSGEAEAVARANRIVQSMDATPVRVPVRARPAFHAAVVHASNHIATVVLAAAGILGEAGLSEEEAVAALTPLARGTLDDLVQLSGRNPLVGPVTRGDAETVALHLRALDGDDREFYRFLSAELVRVCVERGLDQERAAEILQVLDASPENSSPDPS